MRILYVDIDSLRADHLGCYGYHRATSPNIDEVARDGVRFDRLYASDSPCLPSRSALISGTFGIHNGVATHGGRAADPFSEGPPRHFQSLAARTSWVRRMRKAGLYSASISTFAERHAAYHWHAGFNEVFNLGTMGNETADMVLPVADEWLRRNARRDGWFLHVNLWDPHTPYRTPAEFGDPFAGDPIPGWFTDEVRQRLWARAGPHGAQELQGFAPGGSYARARLPRQPRQLTDMDAVRQMFDGYDTGVRYADHHVGRLLNTLSDQGILDETVVMISADHGEALGELAVCGDHHTADESTNRLPLVLRWPGLPGATGGRVESGLRYQIDVAATVLELLGVDVPAHWDGSGFAESLRHPDPAPNGRPYLVLTHGAWTAQRSVRFDDWMYIRTYHDGFHGYPPAMLFDVVRDPHEQHDLATARPDVTAAASQLLDEWYGDAMARSSTGVDPLHTVLQEGGPWHVRGHLAGYLERLRGTGRSKWAELLEARHGAEVGLAPPSWENFV